MFAPLHGTAIQQVPVTRLFGVTPAGQKACMHVHRVFPYLLVPVTTADVDGGLDACGNK
jgi:DNA polymerase zeta